MLFLCARCRTRYKVADEKVQNRNLKIRCRNCSAIIVLKKDNDSGQVAAPPSSELTAKSTAPEPSLTGADTSAVGSFRSLTPIATDSAQSVPAESSAPRVNETIEPISESKPIWFVAVDREKRGPMSIEAVGELVTQGLVNGRSFVWRSGMAGWEHLEENAELKHWVQRAVIPDMTPPNTGAAEVSDYDDLDVNATTIMASPWALKEQEAERVEAERVEAERVEAERVEAERVEAERVETERVEAERIEAERIEAERVEAERVEAERVEAERIEAEKLEAERIEAERVEAERVEAERVEAERVETERVEAERVEAERVEAERVEAERVEAERVEAERIEAERIEAERIEAERIEAERIEAERVEAERIEAERVEAERIEAERIEAERVEAERVEAERVEAERVEAEKLEAEKLEAEKLEAKKLEAKKLEAEPVESEEAHNEVQDLSAEQIARQDHERIQTQQLDVEALQNHSVAESEIDLTDLTEELPTEPDSSDDESDVIDPLESHEVEETNAGVPIEDELVEELEEQDMMEEQMVPPPMPPPLPGHAFKTEARPEEENDPTLDSNAVTEFDDEGLLIVDAITDDSLVNDDDIIELDNIEDDFFNLDLGKKTEHDNPILVTADAFLPPAEELESLAHELSLMIRMEKRNHRKKSMIGVAAVLIVGSMIAVNLVDRSNQAARALANREANSKNPGDNITNPDEALPVYAVAENGDQQATDKPSNASNREILMWESEEAEKKNGVKFRRKARTAPTVKKKELNKEEFAKLTRDSSGKSETLISMGSSGSLKKPKPVENREVSTLISRRSKAFRRCLSASSDGGVSLAFTVERSGNVSNIHVGTGDAEGSAKIKQCVKNIVSKWIFAPVPKPQTFRRSLAL